MSATFVEARPIDSDWLGWLKRELAPTSARKIRTAIIVAGAVLCVVISMTLQVPQLATSAYMVFFISKESKLLTTITGVGGVIVLTIGIAGTLLLYKFTYGHPELRIPGMAIALFLGMWLSRVLVIGPLGFLLGFVVAVSQSVGEEIPSPELLVRGLLWLWVALAYAIAVTVVLNLLFLPDTPQTAAHRPKPKSLLVADAFTNPAHVHFALKVTFAAMFCYIVYEAIDRRSTRAFRHRIPHAAHGNDRITRRPRRLCLGHRGLGRDGKRTDQLCRAADCLRFFLQRFSGVCA